MAQRERMVGRSSPGFSARRMRWTVAGGSSRTLRRELAASFMKLAAVRMKILLRGFGGEVVGALDEGADLAELDEELRRVGRDDEDVGVGLDEDAGVLLVGLAEVFAGGYGLVDLIFEVGGGGDAGAVVADTAEAGEGLAVGPEVAGLALALDRHGEHEGEGVFAGSGGAGEDERVGQAAGGDGGAEVLDGGGVAEEVVEGGRGDDRGFRTHRFCPSPISFCAKSSNYRT